MKFKFENKKVIIISPEKWGKIFLSKHHYAIELAKKGNKVFFLNPPQIQNEKIIVKPANCCENLFVVSIGKPWFYNLKFHFPAFFKFLFDNYIKKIIKVIGTFDVVWNFDLHLFTDAHLFKDEIYIFHLADPIDDADLPQAQNADFIFGVSKTILKPFENKFKEKIFFINHALSTEFETLAKKMPSDYKPSDKIKIGYWGNLMHRNINPEIFKTVIQAFPDVEFILWGPYTANSNLGGEKEMFDFIRFLKNQKNVILKGEKNKKNLVEEILQEKPDILVLFYKFWKVGKRNYDLSNSHKFLEYLSTGRVILSSPVATYNDLPDNLVISARKNTPEEFVELLKKIIDNLPKYNEKKLISVRQKIALDNTYSKRLKEIEEIINQFG